MRPRALATAAVGLLLCVGAALAASAAYTGAAPADLTRGLTPADVQPPMLDDRAYLDGYTLWVQGDGGESLMVSILLSNLAGSPPRPAFSLAYYPVSGAPVHGEVERSGDALRLKGPPLDLAFGANHLKAEGAGYALSLKGEGGLALELAVAPTTPGYRRGDGRVAVGDDTFFMALMAPTGRATGTLTLPGGAVKTLKGAAYLDHSWQDAWPHKVADRWLNLRFFAEGHSAALTTWVTPEGEALAHGVVTRGGALAYATQSVGVTLSGGVKDGETGHVVPARAGLDLGGGIRLDAALGPPLERRDLLGDLNLVLKGVVGALVARPYAWRFRGTATLTLPKAEGGVETVRGVVLAEQIVVKGE